MEKLSWLKFEPTGEIGPGGFRWAEWILSRSGTAVQAATAALKVAQDEQAEAEYMPLGSWSKQLEALDALEAAEVALEEEQYKFDSTPEGVELLKEVALLSRAGY